MAKNLVFKLTCDLCKDSWTVDEAKFKKKEEFFPVKFLTEQNEGRGVSPYFSFVALDLCSKCKQEFLNVYPLTATGAMGYNDFKLRKEATDDKD